MRAEVALAAKAGMVAMGVGNNRFFYRFPGIDIKITCGAIESFGCKLNKAQKMLFQYLRQIVHQANLRIRNLRFLPDS